MVKMSVYLKKAAIAAALLLALGSCGGNTGSQAARNAGDEQVLNLSFTYPLTLDVNDARNSNEFQIMTQVFEGLTRIFQRDGQDVYEPAGAESWTVSPDGLVWTFKLRDHSWSDGVKVTAGQYVDSVKRLLDPEKGFSYATFAFDIAGAEEYYLGKGPLENVGVRAVDDRTLEFRLTETAPQFGKKIAFAVMFPIRLDLIEKGGDTWAVNPGNHAFNGPFVISEWIQDNSMTLTRNPRFWDAANVKLETVKFTVIGEYSTQATLFEAKQLDIIAGSSEYIGKWKPLAERGEIQYLVGKYPQTSLLCFNNKTGGLSGIFGSAKVRQAFSLALDREGLIDTVYNRYIPAFGWFPPGINSDAVEYRTVSPEPLKPLYDEYRNNPAKLRALLKEGLAELGISKDPGDITVTFLTTATSNSVALAGYEYIKQIWEINLGVKVNLRAVETALYREERNRDQYDMIPNGWHGDYDDPMTFAELFASRSDFLQYFGWPATGEYDAAFEKLKGETDNNKRIAIYAELEKILTADKANVAPYYYSDSMNFTQNYVKNLSIPLFGPTYEFSRAYIQGK
ncbi:MAG: peptide ABC transporter substrate-binding protein [Treponema sp.]|nr:peptide ABC transporter substrate-binding protein [Treponema sp.]